MPYGRDTYGRETYAHNLGNVGLAWIGLNGSAGNYISTPDAGVFSALTDFSALVLVALDDWTPAASAEYLMAHRDVPSNNRSWALFVNIDGTINVHLSNDGIALQTNLATSVATGIADGKKAWILETRNSVTGDIKIYTAPFDGDESPPAIGSFTQLGTTLAGITGALFNSTSVLEVGSTNIGITALLVGKVWRAMLFSGIYGSGSELLLRDMNASDLVGIGGTKWVSSRTGETWTRNGTTTSEQETVAQPTTVTPVVTVNTQGGGVTEQPDVVTPVVTMQQGQMGATEQPDVVTPVFTINTPVTNEGGAPVTITPVVTVNAQGGGIATVGAPWGSGDGIAMTYDATVDGISTPDRTAFHFGTQLDLVMYCAQHAWTGGGAAQYVTFVGEGAPFQSWGFLTSAASGKFQLMVSSDGTTATFITSTVGVSFAADSAHWIRVVYLGDDGSGHRVTKFYTSDDPMSTDPASVTWTQLGTTITTVGTITINTARGDPIVVGPVAQAQSGILYYFEIRATENGAAVASVDARETMSRRRIVDGYQDAQGNGWKFRSTSFSSWRDRQTMFPQTLGGAVAEQGDVVTPTVAVQQGQMGAVEQPDVVTPTTSLQQLAMGAAEQPDSVTPLVAVNTQGGAIVESPDELAVGATTNQLGGAVAEQGDVVTPTFAFNTPQANLGGQAASVVITVSAQQLAGSATITLLTFARLLFGGVDGASLVEDFTDALTTPPWHPASSYTIDSGRAALRNLLSYPDFIQTSGTREVIGSELILELYCTEAETNSDLEFLLDIKSDEAGNGGFFRMDVYNSLVEIYAFGTFPGTFAYDPVAMRWWRVRPTATATYVDSSPDGTTWTNRVTVASAPTGDFFDLHYVLIYAGVWTGSDPVVPVFTYVDNFSWTTPSVAGGVAETPDDVLVTFTLNEPTVPSGDATTEVTSFTITVNAQQIGGAITEAGDTVTLTVTSNNLIASTASTLIANVLSLLAQQGQMTAVEALDTAAFSVTIVNQQGAVVEQVDNAPLTMVFNALTAHVGGEVTPVTVTFTLNQLTAPVTGALAAVVLTILAQQFVFSASELVDTVTPTVQTVNQTGSIVEEFDAQPITVLAQQLSANLGGAVGNFAVTVVPQQLQASASGAESTFVVTFNVSLVSGGGGATANITEFEMDVLAQQLGGAISVTLTEDQLTVLTETLRFSIAETLDAQLVEFFLQQVVSTVDATGVLTSDALTVFAQQLSSTTGGTLATDILTVLEQALSGSVEGQLETIVVPITVEQVIQLIESLKWIPRVLVWQ